MLLSETCTSSKNPKRDAERCGDCWYFKDSLKTHLIMGQSWRFTNKNNSLIFTDIKFTHYISIYKIKIIKNKDEYVMNFFVCIKGEYGDLLNNQIIETDEYELFFQKDNVIPDFETKYSYKNQRRLLKQYAKDDIERIEKILYEEYNALNKPTAENSLQIKNIYDVEMQKLKAQIEELEEKKKLLIL